MGAAPSFTLAAVLGACDERDEGDDDGAVAFCMDNSDCYNGQVCDAGACVPTGSAQGPGTHDPSGADPSGADPSGADPTGADPTGADPTGADPTGADPTGADPNPDPSPGCEEGSFACVDDSIEACDNGTIHEYSCADVCATQGWSTSGCNGDQCSCDGYLDQDCALGVAAFCACLEAAGVSCSDDDQQDFYLQCYLGDAPEFACFANYVSNSQVDCVSAESACL
ncbi:MAG: hypothetical protein U0168_29380 [Nannocystaceae bacterium]